MAAPLLSVVVPCRDGATRLPATLASIAAQRIDGPVEVVVTDDASRDGTVDAVRAATFPWGPASLVRHDRARGRAAACNSGLAAAKGKVVVILDDDMTLAPGALESHRRFHDAHTGAPALGRIVLDAPRTPTCFQRFLLREQEARERILLASPDEVPFRYCLTGHFSAPRDLLERAGRFDETISRYGFEDIELGYRLVGSGARIHYLPGASASHRAYMTDLGRYLDRQREAGLVARQLALRYPTGPFREYLRVDGPSRAGAGARPAGLVALRLANRLLLVPWIRRLLGSRAGFAAVRALLAAGERSGLDRITHLGYHVARDIRYFQGCFDDPALGSSP